MIFIQQFNYYFFFFFLYFSGHHRILSFSPCVDDDDDDNDDDDDDADEDDDDDDDDDEKYFISFIDINSTISMPYEGTVTSHILFDMSKYIDILWVSIILLPSYVNNFLL